MRIIEETPEQRIENDISALDDSVTTLNFLMSQDRSEENDNRIIANYKHLELMLVKLDSILNNTQKNTYTSVILSAKQFLNID